MRDPSNKDSLSPGSRMQLFPSVESFEIHPSVFLMEVDESETVWTEKVDDFVFFLFFFLNRAFCLISSFLVACFISLVSDACDCCLLIHHQTDSSVSENNG